MVWSRNVTSTVLSTVDALEDLPVARARTAKNLAAIILRLKGIK